MSSYFRCQKPSYFTWAHHEKSLFPGSVWSDGSANDPSTRHRQNGDGSHAGTAPRAPIALAVCTAQEGPKSSQKPRVHGLCQLSTDQCYNKIVLIIILYIYIRIYIIYNYIYSYIAYSKCYYSSCYNADYHNLRRNQSIAKVPFETYVQTLEGKKAHRKTWPKGQKMSEARHMSWTDSWLIPKLSTNSCTSAAPTE